jgi:hypothetical protein
MQKGGRQRTYLMLAMETLVREDWFSQFHGGEETSHD